MRDMGLRHLHPDRATAERSTDARRLAQIQQRLVCLHKARDPDPGIGGTTERSRWQLRIRRAFNHRISA